MENKGLAQGYAETVATQLDQLWERLRLLRDEGLRHYIVSSGLGCRHWLASDEEHALEQHYDAFPEEQVRGVGLAYEDPEEELDELPLEVKREADGRLAVILTVGGPFASIVEIGHGEGFTLDVFWGTDAFRMRGEGIDRTGEHFRQLVEA